MGNYSIKQLEQLSGVKSHTIRIWEQRYGLLTPKRTDTNIRYYDDDQLRRLLNIATLNNHGHKISKISAFSTEQMQIELLKILNEHDHIQFDESVNGLITAMLSVDEQAFEMIMNDAFGRLGFLQTIKEIIYPFLYKVGVMWGLEEISPPQEHFMSNLIRHRIISEISKLPPPDREAPRIVLFLPENELHDVGLLLAYYQIQSMGCRVIYLGQATPFEHLNDIVNISKPSALLTFFVKATPQKSIQSDIHELSEKFGDLRIFVSGRQDLLQKIKFPKNVEHVEKPDDLQKCLSNL